MLRIDRYIMFNFMSGLILMMIMLLSLFSFLAFAEALKGEGEEKQLAMPPSKLHEFILAFNQAFERQAMLGETPVLMCSPLTRPYIRSIVERVRPVTVVMSQNEVHARVKIKTLGQI